MTLRSIVLDGITIQTTDQGFEAIEKLQKQLSDAKTETATATAALAIKDGEIGTLKIELKNAQDTKPTGALLDKMVADRAALINAASSIAKDAKFDGLSDAEIRKVAVAKAFGDDMVKDASDDQIIGMFKAATRDGANVDPVRKALVDGAGKVTLPDNGQSAYEKRLSDRWRATN